MNAKNTNDYNGIMEKLEKLISDSKFKYNYEYYNWCLDMIKNSHILIAGCSGSGKSVVINDLLYTILLDSPEKNLLCLIDLKMVEMIDYADAPHTVAYIDKPEQVERALRSVLQIIENRYKKMQEDHVKKSSEPTLWVVIDEYADLVTTCPKTVQKMIQRISQVGRAAAVKLILATQRPCREIISGAISCNLDTKLALRTVTAQESRNIIQVNGAESLPDYGYGIMQIKGKNTPIEIPLTSDEDIRERVQYWIDTWK